MALTRFILTQPGRSGHIITVSGFSGEKKTFSDRGPKNADRSFFLARPRPMVYNLLQNARRTGGGEMKVILCYGDSNTNGRDPKTKGRYERHIRWPGVLQDALGDGYHVIEEGLNGRTTVWDDPVRGHFKRDGSMYLLPCLSPTPP
jgi:hypothetical protein